ncbi:MAG: hypothetical protein KDD47_08055, partial [Acidobacteria bacterium]|nr:hypothetical protein [Acidobacteriota bacterium]
MPHRPWLHMVLPALPLWLLASALTGCLMCEDPEPIVYTLRAPEPASHLLEVEAAVPTGGREGVELMMAVWSPGYYKREDYATHLRDLVARSPKGAELEVETTAPNRWRIATGGAKEVVVSYRLLCEGSSVTTNWVSEDYAVINGPATFLTLAGDRPRPHDVRLELPPSWPRVATALPQVRVGLETRYRAADYDTLADSPILAGGLALREFEVEGSRHLLVHAGDWQGFPEDRAVEDLERVVRGTREFWGFLPFERYVFLNVHREAGGGLEHKDSTLVNVAPSRLETPEGYRAWVGLTAHEYLHAWNVKRL